MAADAVAPATAAAATARRSASQKAQRRAINQAADGRRVTAAEAKSLTRAGLSQHQIKLLKTALTRASDGKRMLTPAEVNAVLRDGPLPDPTRATVQRLVNASRDGKLTRKETTFLRDTGVTNTQVSRLRREMRTAKGHAITREQAMYVITGRRRPAPNPVDPADGGQPPVDGGGGGGGGAITPTPTSNVGDPASVPASRPLSATNADGYRSATFPSGNHGAGGQADANGRLYVAAGNELRIFGPDNTAIAVSKLPFAPNDVAPGPDGSFIYALEGTTPRRLNRQADGSYAIDPNFRLDPIQYGGKPYAAEAYRIATDAKGDLFVADGVWTSNVLNTVAKFDPNGKYVTSFGDYVNGNKEDAESWAQGGFMGLSGIAVSPDGNSIYTTEVANGRVQRWDAQANGSYASTKMWANTQADDPNRQGLVQPGKFAAPYDIGLDAQGNVYVMSTTATQVQKFTRDGEFITSMFLGSDDPSVQNPNVRGHGLAVSAKGDAISTETGRMMEHVG
jgi:sugar lactone lactonase YvrE